MNESKQASKRARKRDIDRGHRSVGVRLEITKKERERKRDLVPSLWFTVVIGRLPLLCPASFPP